MIPQDMRESLGIGAGDELILHLLSGKTLLAEVVEPTPLERAMKDLRASAQVRGITPEHVEAALAEVRRESQRRGRTSRRTAGEP